MWRNAPPKKILIALAAVAVFGLGYHFWHKSGNGDAEKGAVAVVGYEVKPELLVQDITAVGTLQATEAATLSNEVAGKVAEIHFTEGQAVKKGDLLLTLDDRNFQQEVNRTEATYALARITYERRSVLRKSGTASAQNKDEAEAGMRESEAALEDAKLKLEKTKITAPFDGIIGLREISVGDYLDVGGTISHIVAVDPMKMEFTLPEKYFSVLKPDLSVYATVDAWPGKEFEGKLYAIDPQVDPDTRNISAKATLANPEAQLRPGMFAFVRLRVKQNDQALLIPEEALIPKGTQLSVKKIVDGKAQSVNVTIGIRRDARAEIIDGLQAGDTIIIAGHSKAQDGTPVTLVPDPRTSEPAAPEKK